MTAPSIMRMRGHRRIVNTDPVMGPSVMRFRGAYRSTKQAFEGWSGVLRLELAGTGIYVSLPPEAVVAG